MRGPSAAALGLVALLAGGPLGCGPWGPLGILAGGPLVGEVVEAPVADWSFTEGFPLIAIETRRGWVRHSVTILCVQDGGELFLMARHAPRKRWIQNLLADPRARLEIDGRIYPVRTERVLDEAGERAVARGFLRKYVGIEVDDARALGGAPEAGDDRAEVWSFRVLPADEAAS